MRAPDRSGFTLVELLVALVISGILGTVLFQVLQGQGRFAEYQSAREEVQQNARAALELITAELRTVGPAGITEIGANSITIRVPRAWGVVCATTGSDLAVFYPPSVREELRVGSDSALIQVSEQQWTASGIEDVTDSRVSDAASACNTALDPTPAADPNATADHEVSDNSLARWYTGSFLTIPPPRALAYLYDRVTYEVADAPDGLDGHWILRNNEPLAGPVAAGDGLRFTYLDGNDASTTSEARVRSVRVEVTTESRTEFNEQPQETRASTVVYLHNRN